MTLRAFGTANTDEDDLDPDVYCLTHGKPLATKGGSYCEDCEPPEPDGEEMFRDRDAEYRESQIEAQRLK